MKRLKLGKTTEDILRQYVVQHLEEILELSKKDMLDADMTLLQVRELQKMARETISTNIEDKHIDDFEVPQGPNADSPLLEEEVNSALTHLKAGQITKDILRVYEIQRLEEILVLTREDLLEADMTLFQVDRLQQIAMEMEEIGKKQAIHRKITESQNK